jgi:hypothetical protein
LRKGACPLLELKTISEIEIKIDCTISKKEKGTPWIEKCNG